MTADTRSKDTIRDAFEAMLALFRYLIMGRIDTANLTAAERTGVDAGDAIGMVQRERSDLMVKLFALRDLVQRAAAEHAQIEGCDVCGRTPTTSGSEDGEQRHVCAEHGGDWTPERIAAELALCERATPGEWFDTRYHSDGDGPHIETAAEKTVVVCALDVPEHSDNAAFIAAARTGYPSALRALRTALGEIERLTVRLRHAEATAEQDAHDSNLNEREAKAEIERLKAQRAPSSPPVDAADMAAITASHERAKQAPAVAGKRSAS